jgi:hypothetical protein
MSPRLACRVDIRCWRPVLREACAVSDGTNDRAGTGLSGAVPEMSMEEMLGLPVYGLYAQLPAQSAASRDHIAVVKLATAGGSARTRAGHRTESIPHRLHTPGNAAASSQAGQAWRPRPRGGKES